GAVSFDKQGTGLLVLTAPSTTTGTFTANAGTMTLNPQRALAAASGAVSVSDYLPLDSTLTLGGTSTFQLSGRANGTSTTPVTGTWNNGDSLITSVSSTAGLAPGQSVSGSGIPAGAYIVTVLTGLPGISGNQFIISANTTAAGTGATITPSTTNSWSTSQYFAGLTLNPGATGVAVNVNGGTETVLNLQDVNPTPGGTVNFTLSTGTQSATNGITLNNTNTNGILGGWARIGNNWAINATDVAGGNVAALATYTDLTRLESGTKTLSSAAASNVRVLEGTGTTPASITPAAAGTTDINTLLASGTTAAVTYDPGTADILRLGAAGGIMVASDAAGLKIGNSANDGVLTAGGADNTAGTIYLTSNNTTAANLLTINSTITDNGTGAVGVTVSGAGITTLAGTNTYTGKTIVGGLSLFNSTDRLTISSEANLGSTPASFVADQLTLAGGSLRNTSAVTLSANRGVTVRPGTSYLDNQGTLTINGVISGTGNINRPGQSGAGYLILNAANTFSGILTNGATGNPTQLQLGNVDALQNATLDTSSNNNQSVTFTAAGSTYNIGGLTGVDELSLGSNTISIGASGLSSTYFGNHTGVVNTASPGGGGITGDGGLIKVGAGTFQLTGASNFTGDTLVSGGTLALSHANALQSSTLDTGASGEQSVVLTMPEGTVYNLAGLQGSDDLDMAVSNLSIGQSSLDTTFSGALKGAFGNQLIKVGGGVLTLAGPSTYTGNTTVNEGTLAFTGSKSYPADIIVNSSGTLSLASGAGLQFAVSDNTNNRITGTGTASLDGNFTILTGGVTLTTGTWTLVDAATLTETFDSSFNVVGYTPNGDGVTWTKTVDTRLWTFSETTGVLTLSVAPAGGTFASWIAGFDFSAFPSPDLTPTGDPDKDGIANGIEFVIGNLPNQTKVENLPTIGLVTNPAGVPAGDYLKFSYRRSTASVDAGVTSGAQYDTDLVGPWTTATDGVAGVTILTVANGAIPGHDVEVYIPRSLAVSGKLFGRLSVVVP
ncbi:MAG: autotransporter-associated beta strand repeat-containing protein, partial [Luteolibacter sp.]|nr:autotransporter-associated beta strand repeat-containing protein [Luteolibacter sp.]